MEYNESFNIPLPFHNEQFLEAWICPAKERKLHKTQSQKETSDLKAGYGQVLK
jgi:hypothetical protein